MWPFTSFKARIRPLKSWPWPSSEWILAFYIITSKNADTEMGGCFTCAHSYCCTQCVSDHQYARCRTFSYLYFGCQQKYRCRLCDSPQQNCRFIVQCAEYAIFFCFFSSHCNNIKHLIICVKYSMLLMGSDGTFWAFLHRVPVQKEVGYPQPKLNNI